MERRISAPADSGIRSTLDRLTTTQPGYDFPFFETKQKALMFAAALGRHLGRRVPLGQRDAGTAIRFDIFEKAVDDGFLSALAVEEAKHLDALRETREDERATIFEEFAHAGLVELNRRCSSPGQTPLDVLLDLIEEARTTTETTDLPGMDAAVLRTLIE
ncbi:MAG: DNA phosphorothioation-associated protein 4 [Candidatus Binatia bacterium]